MSSLLKALFSKHDEGAAEVVTPKVPAAVQWVRDYLDTASTPLLVFAEHLAVIDRIEQVGGLGYISSILDCSPFVVNVRAHAMIVHERWRLRRMQLLCRRAYVHGFRAGEVQKFLDGVVKSAVEIARRQPGATVEDNHATLRRIVAQAREAAASKGVPKANKRGIATGIKSLDDEILGLFPGHKTTIVAPPRVGKTALAWQIAMNVARQGITVGFWSTEMQREELGIRQLAHLASIDSRRLQKSLQEQVLSAEEWNRLTFAMDHEKDFKSSIEIFDETDVSVDDIAAQLGVSRNSVIGALKSGRLPGAKVGSQWRVPREDFTSYMRGGGR
jgi:excisionase family DNA binding protein